MQWKFPYLFIDLHSYYILALTVLNDEKKNKQNVSNNSMYQDVKFIFFKLKEIVF